MTVFVDTSAFLAILNANDKYHLPAKTLWSQLVNQDDRLVCNNYVLVETLALLQHRFGIGAVRLFQADIFPILVVKWVDEEIHSRAISAMLATDRRQLSLVDCGCFETMRAMSIKRVFTFDPHFGDYGFTILM